MMIPVFASFVLLTLYLVFKFLKNQFALLLKAYFLAFGVVIIGNVFSQILELFLPKNIVKKLTEHKYRVPIPSFLQDKKSKKDKESKEDITSKEEKNSKENDKDSVKP